MNLPSMFVFVGLLLAGTGLAEMGAVAIGSYDMPASLASRSAGGLPDCNKSDINIHDCETHPQAPPGTSCEADTWDEAYVLDGNDLDVLAGTDRTWCTGNNCDNITSPAVAEGDLYCNPQPGGGT